jgi:hypothetical protein
LAARRTRAARQEFADTVSGTMTNILVALAWINAAGDPDEVQDLA